MGGIGKVVYIVRSSLQLCFVITSLDIDLSLASF